MSAPAAPPRDAWLAWAPFLAAAAHIVEEFVFPGGFTEWYRRYRPAAVLSFTPRFAFGINALLLAFCLLIPLQGLGPRGSALWLTMAAVLVANALFHLRATVRMRGYSPGLVTAVLLYLPVGAYGYLYLVRTGQASFATAFFAAVMGGSYNWISAGLHRRRSRGAPTPPPQEP